MRTVLAVALLTAIPLYAAIEGTVINKTTGKPQPGVGITLVKPGAQGMQTIGTLVSDATGHFLFEKDQPGGGPQLLQASYGDVNYNKLMTPNVPTQGVELDVFEATKSPAVAHIAQHMIILEPAAAQFGVNETVILENTSNTTFRNPALGGVRFYLPPEAQGQARVSVQGPGGMPLPRSAEKTDQKSIYRVDYPVKPGQTEFDITYTLPPGTPLTFQGRVVGVPGMEPAPLRLIAPMGVTLDGAELQSLGQEPKTQATIYNVLAKNEFMVRVSGIGTLHNPDEASAADAADEPQVTEGPPRIYAHQAWLVALAFSILAVGLVMLFRTSPVQ